MCVQVNKSKTWKGSEEMLMRRSRTITYDKKLNSFSEQPCGDLGEPISLFQPPFMSKLTFRVVMVS